MNDISGVFHLAQRFSAVLEAIETLGKGAANVSELLEAYQGNSSNLVDILSEQKPEERKRVAIRLQQAAMDIASLSERLSPMALVRPSA